MKKALIASTILASLGGAAYAETGVTISGYGRFGLVYQGGDTTDVLNDAGDVIGQEEKTTIHTRLRFNIDAKTETDSGVTFGGRIRMQSSSGDDSDIENDDGTTDVSTGGEFSGANVYASYEGLTVKVGNVDSALENDESGLWFGSEIGFRDVSFGDSRRDDAGNLFFFESKAQIADRVGILASYTVGDFSVQASYIDANQDIDYNDDSGIDDEAEISLYLSYSASGFTVAAGGVMDAYGQDGSDIFFIGGKYAVSDVFSVGLNYTDEGEYDDVDYDSTAVLYGSYTMDALTLKGYVSYNGMDENETNTAVGIGADYDLGGARLSGSIHRGYDEETLADLGVRFDF